MVTSYSDRSVLCVLINIYIYTTHIYRIDRKRYDYRKFYDEFYQTD